MLWIAPESWGRGGRGRQKGDVRTVKGGAAKKFTLCPRGGPSIVKEPRAVAPFLPEPAHGGRHRCTRTRPSIESLRPRAAPRRPMPHPKPLGIAPPWTTPGLLLAGGCRPTVRCISYRRSRRGRRAPYLRAPFCAVASVPRPIAPLRLAPRATSRRREVHRASRSRSGLWAAAGMAGPAHGASDGGSASGGAAAGVVPWRVKVWRAGTAG